MRAVLLGLALFLAGLGPTAAQDPATTCKAMEGDAGAILDAPTHVTAAKLIPAAAETPAYCQIQGYIQPNIGIELRLPQAGWNGKFAEVGCGGFCGTLFSFFCENVVRAGYACIVSDMGHRSTALDAKWAYNNLQAEFDFGIRSTHVVAVAGKALTERYYGRAPRRAYYMGCSTGGRQGMVEAQRFPDDFDGIVAGAPVIDETGDALALVNAVQAALRPDGSPLLTPADVERAHAGAVAACDAADGLKDGLIGDPMACAFDPGTVLPAEKAAAVRRIYAGARNSRGEPIYIGRPLPGSELNWLNAYVGTDGKPPGYLPFMTDMFRYMNFVPDPGPGWTLKDFDWDRDPKRLGMMEAIYSGYNPDLRKFKARGGKLMVYHGWADQSVLPGSSIDYYETVERLMGGRAATQAFFRLFMVPGMAHCIGGEGADTTDYLAYLDAWVERGVAPDMLIARKAKPGAKPDNALWAPPPLRTEQIAFSRPLYPFPLQARYKGRGDPNDAASFAPAPPRR
jgi:feruloyl esterase